MTECFNGGLFIPGKLWGQGPWEMRFRWLRRFFGPWRMDRESVREVYMSKPRALDPSPRVNFLGADNMPWTFMTERPHEVIRCVQRLGYPVRSEDGQS